MRILHYHRVVFDESWVKYFLLTTAGGEIVCNACLILLPLGYCEENLLSSLDDYYLLVLYDK